MKIALHFFSWSRTAVFILGFLALTGCNGRDEAQQASKGFTDYFDIRLGDKTARLQLAVLPLEQQQGLMYRRDLGDNDGMIFIFERPQAMSFWMRNTVTPLDIGFFDASGTLLEVYPMYALDETPVRSRSNRVRYVVEMKQNWYRNNGVRPGVKIDLKAIGAALKARGFDERQLSGNQD